MEFEDNVYQAPKAKLHADNSGWVTGDGLSRRMKFHGQGREYFGIWIVNLLLSIITLGIYSAWATVRSSRYIAGSLELESSRFEYHGRAWDILKGRLLMFGIMVIYVLCIKTNPFLGLAVLLLVALAAPWLVVLALRFRSRNISYRNLRFGFNGSVGMAYIYYFGIPIAAFIVFFIALLIVGAISTGIGLVGSPVLNVLSAIMLVVGTFAGYIVLFAVISYFKVKYIADHIHFGSENMVMGDVFKPWLRVIFIGALGLGVIIAIEFGAVYLLGGKSLLSSFPTRASPQVLPRDFVMFMGLVYGILLPASLVGFQVIHGLLAKVRWNNTRLGKFGFANDATGFQLLALGLTNLLLFVCTLGLAYPWLKMRTLKYNFERLMVLGDASFDEVFAVQSSNAGAAGDAMVDGFGLDVSL